jgi:phosphatidylglycerophosphate synthase
MADQRRATSARRPGEGGRPRSAGPIVFLEVAAVAGAGAAALILRHHRVWAGAVALVGAASLLAGTVRARRSGGRSERLAELLVDRLFDASVLAPLAWVTREASPRVAALALFALGGSFVASYERARGAALGYRASEGVPYRASRDGLLVMGLLTGWIEAALWAFVVLSMAAVLVRSWNVRVQDRPR